jgi:hypothetical protein
MALNIMLVCVVSIDDYGLSCILVVCAFRLSVVDSLVVFLFVVLYWLIFTQCIYCTYDYLPRCSFVFSADVMLCPVVLLEMYTSSSAS